MAASRGDVGEVRKRRLHEIFGVRDDVYETRKRTTEKYQYGEINLQTAQLFLYRVVEEYARICKPLLAPEKPPVERQLVRTEAGEQTVELVPNTNRDIPTDTDWWFGVPVGEEFELPDGDRFAFASLAEWYQLKPPVRATWVENRDAGSKGTESVEVSASWVPPRSVTLDVAETLDRGLADRGIKIQSFNGDGGRIEIPDDAPEPPEAEVRGDD